MLKGYPKNPLWSNPLKELLPPPPFGPPHFAHGGVIALPKNDLNRLQPMPSLHEIRHYANGGPIDEEPIIEEEEPAQREEAHEDVKEDVKEELDELSQAKRDLFVLEKLLEKHYASYDPSKKGQKKKLANVKKILGLIDHISSKIKALEGSPVVGHYFHLGQEYHRLERMRKDLNTELNADEFQKILKEGVNLRKLFRKIDEKLVEREEEEIEEKASRALYKEPEKKYSHFTMSRKKGGLIGLPKNDLNRLVTFKRGGLSF